MSDRLVYYIADGLARHEWDRDQIERPPTFYLNQAEDMLVSYYSYRAKQERSRSLNREINYRW